LWNADNRAENNFLPAKTLFFFNIQSFSLDKLIYFILTRRSLLRSLLLAAHMYQHAGITSQAHPSTVSLASQGSRPEKGSKIVFCREPGALFLYIKSWPKLQAGACPSTRRKYL
jgi:hypothetical protein